VHCWHCCW